MDDNALVRTRNIGFAIIGMLFMSLCHAGGGECFTFCIGETIRARVGVDIPHSARHGAHFKVFAGRLVGHTEGRGSFPILEASFWYLGSDLDEANCIMAKFPIKLDSSGHFSAFSAIPYAHKFDGLGVQEDCDYEVRILIRAPGCRDIVINYTTDWEDREIDLECE